MYCFDTAWGNMIMYDLLILECFWAACRSASRDNDSCLSHHDRYGKRRSNKEIAARLQLASAYEDYRAGVQLKLSAIHRDVYITSTWIHYDD